MKKLINIMNARGEFNIHVGNRDILCATIQIGNDFADNRSVFNLTTGWDSNDFDIFINSLNFDYDSGYGSQNLFGIIWYKDGTWSDRYEYDGSECWDYHTCPVIPSELNRIDKVRDSKICNILDIQNK